MHSFKEHLGASPVPYLIPFLAPWPYLVHSFVPSLARAAPFPGCPFPLSLPCPFPCPVPCPFPCPLVTTPIALGYKWFQKVIQVPYLPWSYEPSNTGSPDFSTFKSYQGISLR